MSATEHQVIMWLAYCGTSCGAVLGGFVSWIAPGRMARLAFGGFGGSGLGALAAALLGVILGFIVQPSDVAGSPGFLQALGWGFLGFWIGVPTGLGGGLLIGAVMAAFRK